MNEAKGIDNGGADPLYNCIDQSSQSNPKEVVTTRLELNWDIDFDAKQITGWAEHSLKVLSASAEYVHFDSIHLQLQDEVVVTVKDSVKQPIVYSEPHPVLGTRLSVAIPKECRKVGSEFTVRFFYTVTEKASALQWLSAAATKGQKYPYCFTQSQAIHARSLFPCMDSPGVKAPYYATVTAPKWCTVLMSALQDDTKDSNDSLKNCFVWKQPVPTPAYLVALAAGNLASREISNRVRVWSEPEVVDSAHYEFGETEDFLKAAEEITGCPYMWTRYDILCLPPSFPYGGMENPCLTFATPTLLAGDRSLADVIAHEIAHSWTGNLVTNITWDHFWLNEGWTVWLERKITSSVRQSPEHGKLSSQIGWKHVQDDIELQGSTNPNTRLVWSLKFGDDPDDAYSAVPYEKGCNLLQYLERTVGMKNFEGFVKSYIEKFKFGTVTSGQFRDHFVSNFENFAKKEIDTISAAAAAAAKKKNKNRRKKGKGGTSPDAPPACTAEQVQRLDELNGLIAAVQQLPWNDLFLTEGVPPYSPDYANSLSKHAESLAFSWIACASSGKKLNAAEAAVGDFQSWSAPQKNIFLETLLNHVKAHELPAAEVFPPAFLKGLDETYHLSQSKNSEIMLRWQTLCLLSECDWIVPYVIDFITTQGRMKFVRPLYRALLASEIGHQLAVETFKKHKDSYHPIARKMLAADISRVAQLDDDEGCPEEEEQSNEMQVEVNGNAVTDATVELKVENEKVPIVAEQETNGEIVPESETALEVKANERISPVMEEETSDEVIVESQAPAEVVDEPIVSKAVTETVPTPVLEETTTASSASEEVKTLPKPLELDGVETSKPSTTVPESIAGDAVDTTSSFLASEAIPTEKSGSAFSDKKDEDELEKSATVVGSSHFEPVGSSNESSAAVNYWIPGLMTAGAVVSAVVLAYLLRRK